MWDDSEIEGRPSDMGIGVLTCFYRIFWHPLFFWCMWESQCNVIFDHFCWSVGKRTQIWKTALASGGDEPPGHPAARGTCWLQWDDREESSVHTISVGLLLSSDLATVV